MENFLKDIHSLGELREALKREDAFEQIKDCLDDKTLYDWLKRHYYELEADGVKYLSAKKDGWLPKLAEILKVPYNPLKGRFHNEDESYEQRVKMLKEAAGYDHYLLPDNMNLVVVNQEELAALLDAGEKVIYLCKGEFVIPLSKNNMRYIGINHPVIENAFTLEQYKKAGIQVENIDLPERVDDSSNAYALEKAVENGYDIFYDHHGAFVNAVHGRLSGMDYYEHYFLSDYDSSVIGEYQSEHKAKSAVEGCIRKAYTMGGALFDTKSDRCIAKEVADFYSRNLLDYYESFNAELKAVCESIGKIEEYEQVDKRIKNCHAFMYEELKKELQENQDYYEMYDFDYFVKKVDIDEIDSSIETEGIFSLIEKVFTETKTYFVSDIFTSLQELEKDVNDRASAFFRAARTSFDQLEADVEKLLEQISKELEPMQKDETVGNYLHRAVRKASA